MRSLDEVRSWGSRSERKKVLSAYISWTQFGDASIVRKMMSTFFRISMFEWKRHDAIGYRPPAAHRTAAPPPCGFVFATWEVAIWGALWGDCRNREERECQELALWRFLA